MDIQPLKADIGQWGNSLAVRIPAGYAKVLGIEKGDTVQLSIEDLVKNSQDAPGGKYTSLADLRGQMAVEVSVCD